MKISRDDTGLRIETSSPDETRSLGRALARALPQGAVVALVGELGAGKTTLVQGAALELCPDGAEDFAISPTFVLVREHGSGLIHMDAHRLRSSDDLIDLGGDDFIGKARLSFVEWADRVMDALPADTVRLHLAHAAEAERSILIEARNRPELLERVASLLYDFGKATPGSQSLGR